jgi:hypothetical protein
MEPLGHLPKEDQRVLRCEARVPDQIADVLAVDVLEEHVRRPVAGQHVGVDDAHQVRVLG